MNTIFKDIYGIVERGSECVLITVVEKNGHGPSQVGRRIVVTPDGKAEGTIGGGTLELLALKEAKTIFSSQESYLKRYLLEDKENPKGEKTGMLCGGEVLLFFEYIGSSENVFIFGAGHIGKNVIKLMEPLDFKLNIMDTRKGTIDGISEAKGIFIEKIDSFFKDIEYMKNGFVLISTHSHDLDYRVLKNILKSGVKLKYLGMIASDKKLNSMIEKFEQETGEKFDKSLLYSPAGLNIGGSTPVEIALAVVAEIQSVKYGIDNTLSLTKTGKDKNGKRD